MKQLTGIDAGFLYMETRNSYGHVNSVSIHERPDDPDFDPYTALRSQFASRLALLEPFRRRLVEVPLGLDHPYWVLDPDFDIDFHVRHIAIPPPGDDEQLANQVARIISRPLDRSHPLWEMYVMEGLSSGDFAVFTKIHHAAIDGAAGAALTSILLDTEPDAVVPEPTELPGERVPSQSELLARTAATLALRPGKAIRVQIRLLRELANVTRNQGFNRIADSLRAGLPGPAGNLLRRFFSDGDEKRDEDHTPLLPKLSAPPTPFNHHISPHRRFAFGSVSLADIKTLKNALGVTVNDVVMAICAGALRRWLEDHDALPEAPLVAGIPVSVRTGDEEDPWTNRVSMIFADLPTNAPEALDRVKAVHNAMAGAKDQFDLLPADLLLEASDLVPAGLATRAARLATRVRLGDRVGMPLNVVISNVPGPRNALYAGGARLKHYYPVSTIVEGQGLNITVQSYCDVLDFGLVSCRELVPDLWNIMEYCVDELDVLFDAAGLVRS